MKVTVIKKIIVKTSTESNAGAKCGGGACSGGGNCGRGIATPVIKR